MIEKINKRLLEDLHELMEVTPIRMSDMKYSELPEVPGIYVFSDKDANNIVYVGKASDLRDRIYRNHLMGDSAASVKGKMVKKHRFSIERAKEYMKQNFLVRFKPFPSKDLTQIEHFVIAIFNPKYND